MKHKNLLFLISSLIMIAFNSCEELIEKDLSKKNLIVISPSDSASSPNFTQTFYWEELKGAEKYQIQIAKPSFAAMQQFIVDSSVSGTKFTFTLQPGAYQWRIRAKNNSSYTEYITRTIIIDSTLNLSGQVLGLSTPIDNIYSKTLSNNYIWYQMPNAQYYVFQVLENGTPIQTQSYTSLYTSYTFSREGIYQWRVFAQNNLSNSSYSTRTITIDTTRPSIPSPTFPLTDTITAQPIQFTWNTFETGISSQLQISTDSSFNTVNYKDTVFIGNSYKAYNLIVGQPYYWRVKTIDKALNESQYFYRRRIRKN